jgi:cobalamin biosynthesis protein CobT
LISKIYDAIKAGEISLSDDEDEEEDDDVDDGEVESEDDEDNEVPDGTEDDDEDEESDESDEEEEESDDEEDEDEDTEARTKAMTALEKKIRKDFKKGNVTVSDMKEFLSSYDDVKVGKKTSDEKVLELYIENAKMLVDDDGDTIEEGAYEIKGVPFCCGRALDIDEDGNCKCPICGNEYELGEDE